MAQALYSEILLSGGEDFTSVDVHETTTVCIDYPVYSKPVSMHIPLTRLLAGLSVHMGKFGLTFSSNEFDIKEKPSIQSMLEPALRTMVFVAQVQAGMWRRNRDSLNSQVIVYHGSNFRKQVLDQVTKTCPTFNILEMSNV